MATSRLATQQGELVAAIKSMVSNLIAKDNQVYVLRLLSRQAQEAGPDVASQVIPVESMEEILDLAMAGLQDTIKETHARLGQAIIEAARHGVDVFRLDIDPKFMLLTARDAHMRKIATEELLLPHARILDIIRELQESFKADLAQRSRRRSRSHEALRLEGSVQALQALVVRLESEELT